MNEGVWSRPVVNNTISKPTSGTIMKQDMQGYLMHKLVGMEELNANLQHIADLLEEILMELRDNKEH